MFETSSLTLLSFKGSCQANPGAVKKREGWISFIWDVFWKTRILEVHKYMS